MQSLLDLAVEGFSAALLPRFLGDSRPALVRIGKPSDIDVGLWILTHPDLRRSASVRAFMDFAGGELASHPRRIEGAEGDERAGPAAASTPPAESGS